MPTLKKLPTEQEIWFKGMYKKWDCIEELYNFDLDEIVLGNTYFRGDDYKGDNMNLKEDLLNVFLNNGYNILNWYWFANTLNKAVEYSFFELRANLQVLLDEINLAIKIKEDMDADSAVRNMLVEVGLIEDDPRYPF